jgi:hypothetical protein
MLRAHHQGTDFRQRQGDHIVVATPASDRAKNDDDAVDVDRRLSIGARLKAVQYRAPRRTLPIGLSMPALVRRRLQRRVVAKRSSWLAFATRVLGLSPRQRLALFNIVPYDQLLGDAMGSNGKRSTRGMQWRLHRRWSIPSS